MQQAYSLPRGFRAAGLACGIKTDPTVFDLALFSSDVPCAAAGMFTQNRVVGAPVKLDRERAPRDTARAVIINSGNANACTGERGLEDAHWMTEQTAAGLGCAAEDVLVCSTGVIGVYLPREKLAAGIPKLVEQRSESDAAFANAARGMLTTDTVPKIAVREAVINDQIVRVSGAAKGAAMIAPNMATMLAVIMTDARLSSRQADEFLRRAVDDSFNCICVEGHTSTSDTVFLLANGQSAAGELDEAGLRAVAGMIEEVAAELAQMIVRDAEGAEHFVTIDVRGTRTRDEAAAIAKTVAEGPLVKTAIAGNDPNWGRIVSAVGYAGVDLQEENISLRINGTPLYREGAPVPFDETAVSEAMRTGDVHVELDLTLGDASVRCWTCDLTQEYVRLNSDYTT